MSEVRLHNPQFCLYAQLPLQSFLSSCDTKKRNRHETAARPPTKLLLVQNPTCDHRPRRGRKNGYPSCRRLQRLGLRQATCREEQPWKTSTSCETSAVRSLHNKTKMFSLKCVQQSLQPII